MVLQDDIGLMWNNLTRLPDTDFGYKALPARTKQQAPKLPAKSSLVQRAQPEGTADQQPVGLPSWKLWHCSMQCQLKSRYVCVSPYVCMYVIAKVSFMCCCLHMYTYL